MLSPRLHHAVLPLLYITLKRIFTIEIGSIADVLNKHSHKLHIAPLLRGSLQNMAGLTIATSSPLKTLVVYILCRIIRNTKINWKEAMKMCICIITLTNSFNDSVRSLQNLKTNGTRIFLRHTLRTLLWWIKISIFVVLLFPQLERLFTYLPLTIISHVHASLNYLHTENVWTHLFNRCTFLFILQQYRILYVISKCSKVSADNKAHTRIYNFF